MSDIIEKILKRPLATAFTVGVIAGGIAKVVKAANKRK